MDGEKAVAVTTQTNDLIRKVNYFGKNLKLFYGRPLPENVELVMTARSVNTGKTLIKWNNKGDPTHHMMEFEETDEGVTAILVAMRMS